MKIVKPDEHEPLHERVKGIEVWQEQADEEIKSLKTDNRSILRFISYAYGLAAGLSLIGVAIGYKLRKMLGLD